MSIIKECLDILKEHESQLWKEPLEESSFTEQDLSEIEEGDPMTAEEQYQRGVELWELAKQLEHDMISSSEARRQMLVYQKQAFECWKQAAEQGYAKAQYQLGEYYYHYGRNTNKNKKAFEWYSKAAEQGYALAQYRLGFLYGFGGGVLQDAKMSRYWYEKAAAGGMSTAAQILGDQYSQGKSRNYKKAIDWYMRARDTGYQIGWCFEKLKDFDNAIMWYARGVEEKDSQAAIRLAQLYEEGAAVTQDLQRAREYYRIAANLGHPDAKIWLEGHEYEK